MKQRFIVGLLFLIAVIGSFGLVVVLLANPQIKAMTGAITNPVIQAAPTTYPQAAGRILGSETSPVKIEVFEDFQCPACNIYSQTVEPQIIANLVEPGKAYYIFRNYPFLDTRVAGGKESHQAANASMCAADQNRFWEFKALLFANQKAENSGGFSDARLLTLAQSAKLDLEKFQTCFESNSFKTEIDADYSLGYSLRIGGTPAVYVNGVNVKPGFIPTFEEVAAAVEAALK